eukprot:gene8672-619_t
MTSEVKIDTPLKKAYNKKVKESTNLILVCEEDCEKKYKICGLIENIMKNIIAHPKEDKFKTLKKTAKKIDELIVQPTGVAELLEVIGFTEKDDCFVLTQEVSEETLSKTIELIEVELTKEFGINIPKDATKSQLEKARAKQLIVKEKKKAEKEFDEKAKKKALERIEENKEKRREKK